MPLAMRRIGVALLAAVSLSAGPVLLPDSVDLSPTDSGLGRQIYASPGTCWTAGLNDNPSGVEGDFDFNDAMAKLCFGSASGNSVAGLASWIGASTAHLTALFIGTTQVLPVATPTPFISPVGDEVILRGVDSTAGYTWFSGPADRNPGGGIQFWVTQNEPIPTETPDASTALMVASGAATIWAARRRRA